MARKGENIYKRKDGRWEGRYIRLYDEFGKPKYGYIYAKTYSEAKQKLAEQRCQPAQIGPHAIRGNITYNDILSAWLYSSQTGIKESTFVKYCQIIDCHIRPALGQHLLCKISTQKIESFVQNQLISGRLDGKGGLSPKTVIDMLSIIKESMSYARDNGLTVICNLERISIKNNETEMRVLTPKEQESLVRVLLNDIDLYKFGVILSLYTGIRIGELCALQWDNLILSSSTLRVRKTIQRIQDRSENATTKTKVIITTPKSKQSIRDIPLPTFIIGLARQFESAPKAYVLTGEEGKYIEPRTMQNRFKRYIAIANVDDANFHALRHTFATRCIELGFDIKTLSEILGHSNVNITLSRYVHSSFDLKRSNMSKLVLPV